MGCLFFFLSGWSNTRTDPSLCPLKCSLVGSIYQKLFSHQGKCVFAMLCSLGLGMDVSQAVSQLRQCCCCCVWPCSWSVGAGSSSAVAVGNLHSDSEPSRVLLALANNCTLAPLPSTVRVYRILEVIREGFIPVQFSVAEEKKKKGKFRDMLE